MDVGVGEVETAQKNIDFLVAVEVGNKYNVYEKDYYESDEKKVKDGLITKIRLTILDKERLIRQSLC